MVEVSAGVVHRDPVVAGKRLMPWVAGAVASGVVAGRSSRAALLIGILVLLAAVPMVALFALLVAGALAQGYSVRLGGYNFRPEMLVATVFALRALVRSKARMTLVEGCLLAFLVLLGFSSWFYSPSFGESVRSAALIGFGAMAYLGVVAYFTDVERLRAGVRIFLALSAVGSAVGLLAFAWNQVSGSSFGVTPLDTLRGFPAAVGLATEHDLFGSTCAAVAVVFVALWREDNGIVAPRWAATGALVCAAGALAGLARGAWIAFAVGCVVVLAVQGRKQRGIGELVAAAVVALVVVAVYAFAFVPGLAGELEGGGEAVGAQAQRILDFGSSTGAARAAEWRVAYSEVSGSPWFGLGANSYGQRHQIVTERGPIPAFLGNWAVRTLYDVGVVGLAFLVVFLVGAAWPGRQVRRSDGDVAVAARALAAGCAVLAVAYLATDGSFFTWPWIMLGLTRAANLVAGRAEFEGPGAEVV